MESLCKKCHRPMFRMEIDFDGIIYEIEYCPDCNKKESEEKNE